ncbi:MAG: branched-chain amino acid aminotransferase [Flavobacteriaceae bacterium]|nr:branched-chain amino acid aminotransferase [Flavobacteriaceae bacterium]
METTILSALKIKKIKKSKLDKATLNNRKFGSTFTDHLFICTFKNGKWQKPKIKPYKPLKLEPSARVFHYGQAVFEGMKAYKDNTDQIWLFRPDENQLRINASAKRLAMPEFPKELFFEGLETLLKIERDWIPTEDGNSLYIRPFMIASGKGIFAAPSEEYTFMIICSPSGKYYTKDVQVVIAEYYSRAANGGVGAAKAAGNYGAQFYPTQKAIAQGYDQIIWTDSNHEYLEEAGTMNVFFRINDTLITAPTSERILDGITRKSIIAIAKASGIKVEVRKIKVTEIKEAVKNGTLKEMFGSGTAAVVTPISHFSHQNTDYEIAQVKSRYSDLFKKILTDIQYNKSEDKFGWRYKV